MSLGKKKSAGDGGAGALAAKAGARADAAAAKITQYGDQAVSFSNDFFAKYVEPQLAVIQQEQAKGIARADEIARAPTRRTASPPSRHTSSRCATSIRSPRHSVVV